MLRFFKPRVNVRGTPLGRSLSHLPIDDDLFGLTDEQKEIRSSFRNFFETELGPHVKAIDDNDDYPGFREYMKKCGDMGILGLTVPEEYGGTDMGYFAHILSGEENGRVAAGIAMRYDVIGKL